MYSKPKEEGAPPTDAGKYVRIGIVVAIGCVVIVGNDNTVPAPPHPEEAVPDINLQIGDNRKLPDTTRTDSIK